MAVSGYDILLNGVGYNLAEDAQGDHYVLSGEPLRPPNAVTVQGESQQIFQMRPDVLQWSLTDWSGGEGQIKFDPNNPSTWRELTNVRVFDFPGKLQAGWYIGMSGGSTSRSAALVVLRDTLWAIEQGANDNYQINGDPLNPFSSVAVLTGPTNGVCVNAVADGKYIYFAEYGTDNIWRGGDAGDTFTQIDSGAMSDSNVRQVAEVGDYVFALVPSEGQVWEILKAGGGTDTIIDDFASDAGYSQDNYNNAMTSMDGKLYVLVPRSKDTIIREIVPSSAAGTGFGREMTRLVGFVGEAIWNHSGVLYMFGRFGTDNDAAILYLTPGGEYGSLGRIRPGTSLGGVGVTDQNGSMLTHYVAMTGPSGNHIIYEIDSVTGGMAQVAVNSTSDNQEAIYQAVLYQGHLFFSSRPNGTDNDIQQGYSDSYIFVSEPADAVSAWHDFGIVDQKILSSISLSCEALPEYWVVYVDYASEGSTSWTNAITYSTENGTGIKAQVSTDTSTIKFRTLSLRIRLSYERPGGGTAPDTPTILGLDVLAQVAKPQPVWRLLLDLSDEKGRTANGHSGKLKIDNIVAAAALEQVIDFQDGYQNHNPGEYNTYDVVVDSYDIMLNPPGEGVARIVLRGVA